MVFLWFTIYYDYQFDTYIILRKKWSEVPYDLVPEFYPRHIRPMDADWCVREMLEETPYSSGPLPSGNLLHSYWTLP